MSRPSFREKRGSEGRRLVGYKRAIVPRTSKRRPPLRGRPTYYCFGMDPIAGYAVCEALAGRHMSHCHLQVGSAQVDGAASFSARGSTGAVGCAPLTLGAREM